MANFQPRRIPLNDSHRCPALYAGVLGLLLALFSGPAWASPAGKIWGRILDARNNPVAGASIKLSPHSSVELETLSDRSGYFGFFSLPAGTYKVGARKDGLGSALKLRVLVADASDIEMELVLSPDAAGAMDESTGRVFDFSALNAQTTISAEQIALLPSGNSLGSLLENQDFSATTNRIDVGGLWNGLPTLWSARGGASWTQNVYLLNGLDVGDPVWTGQPLWLPDVFSLASVGHDNAVHSARDLSPGGQLSMSPKSGTPNFHGGAWAFYSDKSLTSDNITPALKAERLFESSRFNRLMDLNVHLSGSLSPGGPTFFTSWSTQSLGRKVAGFETQSQSSIVSGFFNVEIPLAESLLKVVWAGQSIGHDAFGAGDGTDWAATVKRTTLSNILQVLYETKPGGLQFSRFGLSWALADAGDSLHSGVTGPVRADIFGREVAAAPLKLENGVRNKLVLAYDGTSLFPRLGITAHRLEYGLQTRLSTASLTEEIPANLHLRFVGDRPAEVAFFQGPFATRTSSLEAGLYIQDTISFSFGPALRIGLHGNWTSAGNGTSNIRWFTLAPRLELTLPLSRRKTSAFKVSASRYGFTLPLNYLVWGDPQASGSLIYKWTDADGNGAFESAEIGPLLRREGPAFSAIDPGIRRPSADEFVLAYVQEWGSGWRFTLSGFLRRTQDLIETINTGVSAADYQTRIIHDSGDNRIPGDLDDLTFSLFDRNENALGLDFFLLTNPDADSRLSTYKGLDLTLVKVWDERFLFYLALTAMQIVGSTNPGNSEWENDDGVIGGLFDDPNASINARGRMRFDRAYTARIGLSVALPFGTRLGLVAKYYDGQPFARKIIIEDLNQGPLYIQAHPRGVARYEYNMTVDLRLEKSLSVGTAVCRFLIDAFNLFNQNLATQENEWTGPEFPRRLATAVQSPRVIRVGFNFEF